MTINVLRSYRCNYHPKGTNGLPALAESGVLPFIQLKAANAEAAHRAAFYLTGCVIDGVERIEGGAA